ncbi:AraC-like DNA-binding protein [Epilithonimonas hungarica]|uniref:helix-turn-helix domain-containing protein n=1 Tax=Epilithonimonas hungarica TaxID=454006 RepID=UPI0027838C8A|nr:helix-turn-helix domain-containing protein [Epilithonimonas hungarica]MDP9957868.1 AraC-like DNA-binding protein [Epilithonimonas hungarica]
MMINLLRRRFFFSFFLMFCTVIISGQSGFKISEQKKLNDLFHKAQSISNDQPDKALKICFQILKEAKGNYPEASAHTYLLIGQIYSQKGNHEKAIQYAKKGKEEFHELKMEEYEADALRLIASEYNFLGLTDEANKKIDEAINIAKENPKAEFYNESLGNLYSIKASFYSKPDSLLKYDKLSLLHFQKTELNAGNSHFLAQAYINLGSDYLAYEENTDLNKSDSAIVLLNKALEVNQRYGNKKRIETYIIFNRAKAYFYKKEYEKAERDYLQALSSAKKLGENYLIKDIYLRLKEMYLAKGDKANQLIFQEKYNKINDSLVSLEKKSLNKEVKDIQETQQKSFFKTKRNLVIIISAIVLLLFISIFITVKNYKRSKKEFANYQKIIEKLQNQESLIPAPVISNSAAEKTTFSVSSDKEVEILKKLEKFERSEGFKNKNLSLSSMAESLGTNTAYLSTVINSNKNKNFNNYINELRINYIIHKLKNDPQYLKYKISHLAEECGFSSHNTFTIAFSNLAGVSPSNFVKFLTKERQIPEN